VMLSHRNLIHNLQVIIYSFEHEHTATGVTWLPTYHDMGLIGGLLSPLSFGRSTQMMSPVAFLQKPIRWLRAIDRTRALISGGPNSAYQLCVDKVSDEEAAELVQRRRTGSRRNA